MSSENYIIKDQNAPHFPTFTTVDWIDVFTREGYKSILIDSLKYCQQSKGLQVFAWCLMSNHIHLVCRVEEPFLLSDFVRDFKKYTAKAIISVMETISIRIGIIVYFLLLANISFGQERLLKELKFENTFCVNGFVNYNEILDCNLSETKDNYNENDPFIEDFYKLEIWDCDSIIIEQLVEIDRKPLKKSYTNYIKTMSEMYVFSYNNKVFNVGDSIEIIAKIFPEVIKQKLRLRDKKGNERISQENYIVPFYIIEETDHKIEKYQCQGLKFNVANGIVSEIILDFRTDGFFY